jgi:hypothetical protein
MSKAPNYHAGERVGLGDFRHSSEEFPSNLRDQLAREILGTGVLEGFDIRVLDQSGPDIGAIEISNGRALDWGGRFVSSETGTTAERVELRAPDTEFWLEIEILFADSDPDARAFWDPLVNNADPIPDGQEVDVSRVYTRKVPMWRVVQPIRNNPAGRRSDGGYTPAHFNASNLNVVPRCILRTDGSGKITAGDPNADVWGNDLISVNTTSGAQTYVKKAGYGESRVWANPPTNTVPLVYGRKSTDQRPRMFESVVPPFSYGASGEVLGSPYSDMWARDIKSQFDHLAAQIGQIKNGSYRASGEGSQGHYHDGKIKDIDPDGTWVDLRSVSTNASPPGTLTADPDQFLGCSFWVTSGPWGGFYARVIGNDRTDGGSGETRLYLAHNSSIPSRVAYPAADADCLILQDKQANWLTPPTPNSNQRGLNSLDDEVVSARTDWWSGQTFDLLGSRLNANKMATITFAPPDPLGPDPDTGEPQTNLWPRADVFESIVAIRTAFANLVSINRPGVVQFRAGTYDFDTVAAGTPAFSMTGSQGWTIQGDGRGVTVLELDDHAGTIFDLSACQDVTFRDMTISAKGTPVKLSGCNRIRFENCHIVGEFDDLATATMEVGSGAGLVLDNCSFALVGTGIVGSALTDAIIRACFFVGDTNATQLDRVFSISGQTARTTMHDNHFSGFGASYLVYMNGLDESFFHDNTVKGNTALGGTKLRLGNVTESVVGRLRLPRESADDSTEIAISISLLRNSVVDDVWSEGTGYGVLVTGGAQNCILRDIVLDVYDGDGYGLLLEAPSRCIVEGYIYTSTGNGTGIQVQSSSDRLIVKNAVISGSTLSDGIYFSAQSSFRQVALENNQIRGTQRGINIANATTPESFLCEGNMVNECTVAAYVMKFSTTTTFKRMVFDQNQCEQTTGLGFSLEMTSCTGQYLSVCHNHLEATERAFEVWSSNAGVLNYLGAIRNVFESDTYTPVAIGTAASGAAPSLGGVPFVIYWSHIESNELSGDGQYGSMWLSSLYNSYADRNQVYATTGYGIKVEYLARNASICGNDLKGGSNVVSRDGLISVPRNQGIEDSRISGNRLDVSGDNFTGIYLGDDCEDNQIAINHVLGSGGTAQCFLWASDLIGSTIVGNQAKGTAFGAELGAAQNNMISSNLFRGMTGGSPKYFSFTVAATNNRGGNINPAWLVAGGGPGPDATDWGDESGGNRIGNYLSTFNHAF